MIVLKNDYIKEYDTISEEEQLQLNKIQKKIENKQEMLDWLDIETTISAYDIKKIQEIASEIRENCDIFLIIGIGGSYLGAKAIIDSLTPYFHKTKPEIIFLGYHLSEEYFEEIMNYIHNKKVYVNVISKSGNTLETDLAFQKVYQYLKEYDPDYKKKIIITTDSKLGKLRELVIKENFRSFSIPQNIGGRFSILTAVGLLPAATAGIDIMDLLNGAKTMRGCYPLASRIALIRHHLEQVGKKVEAVTFYEEKLSSFSLWYQQLFAETQGKQGKGILPISNLNTTNLHSLGQYFQEGTKQVFETVVEFESENSFQQLVLQSVAQAHLEGDTPSLIISIPKLNAYYLGELIYLLEMTSAIGAYLLEVNPFNQPGVEKYKENIRNELEKMKE